MSARRVICGAGLLVAAVAAAQEWQGQWEPDRPLTDLLPRAEVVTEPGASIVVRAGAFVVASPALQSGAYLGIGTNPPGPGEPAVMGDAKAWDGRKPTTVEVRLRVVELTPGAGTVAQVYVGNGRDGWLLNVGPNGPPGVALQAGEFHTYRITLKQGIANLYVDGHAAPDTSLAMMSYPRNGMLVGDFSSSAGGTSEWQYIRWTNREATPWQASAEALRRLESLLVVVGDREEDVEEANITPPFGEVTTLPDGRVMSWYPIGKQMKYTSQSEEVVEDANFVQKAYARFSADDGRTWTEPQWLFDFPREPGSRTEGMAFTSRSGAVHLWGLNFFYCDVQPPFEYGLFRSDLWHARSPDGGRTWEAARKVDFGFAYTGATNSAIQLASGRLLVPISRYSDRPTGRFVTCVPYSDDDGVTWHKPVDEVVVDTGGAGLESGACEPVATELRDGRVWMLVRAQDGYQWETFSSDGGLHWSAPAHSRFISTNSPVATLRLRDGRILVLWNNCGSDNNYNRRVLCAALTPDDGKTWMGYREIARRADNGVYAYPFVTEARDGRVVVVMLQGTSMVRLDPEFLTRTALHEEFAQGLGKWSHTPGDGATAIPHPDGGGARVLRLCKPEPDAPAGVCTNFPFGISGELSLKLRIEPGFQGAHFALNDHFDDPGLAKEGTFSWRITAAGKVEALAAGLQPAAAEAAQAGLTPGTWHELQVAWDCTARQAVLTLDGKPVARAPQLLDRPGVCYLRLRSTAEQTDTAGLLVRSLVVTVKP
jgi:hypothetical protein